MYKIAIDAMGGDFGFLPIVEGTILALKKSKEKFGVILVGNERDILSRVPKKLLQYIEIVPCSDMFEMSGSATDVLKREDSSIFKAIELVREGRADAIVSAGHSGATMSLSTLKLKRLKGVLRPAIATFMPTTNGKGSIVLDIGANVDCKSEHLFEFAIMGEAYAKEILNTTTPRVGLLSNGEEDSKGNEVTKEAFKLLQTLPSFVGNVEGSDIFNGSVDVVTCDGFVGNILLKASEGVATSITTLIKQNIKRSPTALTGALLMRRVFKLLKKQMDYAEYGGAPLLGVSKPTIICHGKSNKIAIKNAIYQALIYAKSSINEDIEKNLKLYKNN
jgi:glycerol-3-phosphate acyltransferase PlsX